MIIYPLQPVLVLSTTDSLLLIFYDKIFFFCLCTFYIGLILSPGTTQLRAGDIQHRLQLSGAKCIIADNSTRDLIDQVI